MNGPLGFLLSDTRPQMPMPRVARRYRGFTRRQQALVPVPPQCFKNRMTTGEYSLAGQRMRTESSPPYFGARSTE